MKKYRVYISDEQGGYILVNSKSSEDALEFAESKAKSEQHAKEIKTKLKNVYKDIYKSVIKLEKQNGKHVSNVNK